MTGVPDRGEGRAENLGATARRSGNGRFPTEPYERLWKRVEITDSCWLWHGWLNKDGYGLIHLADTRKAAAVHRVAYEELVGPIPEGFSLDHLCRVRNCVNPAHLEPVTNAENLRRAGAQRDHHVELRRALEEAIVAIGRAIPRVPPGLRPVLQRAWDAGIDALEKSDHRKDSP